MAWVVWAVPGLSWVAFLLVCEAAAPEDDIKVSIWILHSTNNNITQCFPGKLVSIKIPNFKQFSIYSKSFILLLTLTKKSNED